MTVNNRTNTTKIKINLTKEYFDNETNETGVKKR